MSKNIRMSSNLLTRFAALLQLQLNTTTQQGNYLLHGWYDQWATITGPSFGHNWEVIWVCWVAAAAAEEFEDINARCLQSQFLGLLHGHTR